MDLFKREAEGYSVEEVEQFVKKAQQKIYDLQQSLDVYTNQTTSCELKQREKDLIRRTFILDKIFNKLFLLVKNKLSEEETKVFLELCRDMDKITKVAIKENAPCDQQNVVLENPNGEPLINLEDVYNPDESLAEMCKGLNIENNK